MKLVWTLTFPKIIEKNCAKKQAGAVRLKILNINRHYCNLNDDHYRPLRTLKWYIKTTFNGGL